ncbi:MAG: 2-aminoethylphosphonate aminotransferase [Polyangiales bacterium]
MTMILLNPGPANTTDSVKRALTLPDICPREREFGDVLLSVRDRLTKVVHAHDRYTTVLVGGSGTAAVEMAIASTVPSDGRLLVIDNGAYGTRMAEIAAAYGIPHDVEQLGVGGYPDVERIAKRLGSQRYTQLGVVHHETSTGMLNPIAQIAAQCQRHGVEVIVDAMSSYAGMPIDVEAVGVDYLIASSNKCIQGMAGLGFVVCRTARLQTLRPIAGRSYYLNLASQHRFLEKTGQMQFTPPVQVVYALEQALTELEAEGGVVGRHRRYLASFETLDTGMLKLGFRRLLPEAILSRILTAYLEPDHPNYNFDAMHDSLYAKGFTIYPGKGAQRDTFRLANMGAIDVSDLQRFIQALSDTLDELKVRPLYASVSE